MLLGIGMGLKEVTVPVFSAENAPTIIRGMHLRRSNRLKDELTRRFQVRSQCLGNSGLLLVRLSLYVSGWC
jgi:hypothetical protein